MRQEEDVNHNDLGDLLLHPGLSSARDPSHNSGTTVVVWSWSKNLSLKKPRNQKRNKNMNTEKEIFPPKCTTNKKIDSF